jgi:superfamily II DNA or RNA helicase
MQLRPYQQAAIDKLRAAFGQGHKRVILCAPTGAGKTVMFSAIAEGAMKKGKRVMIVTDRGELLWQAGGALNNLAIVPELITAETSRLNPSQRIFVAMIETIYRRRNQADYRMLLESVDLFIFDECHKRTFDKLLPSLPESALVLGATATPWREGKGTSMRDVYSAMVEASTIPSLIHEGYLAKPSYYSVPIDLREVKTKGGDYDADSLAEVYSRSQIYKGVVTNYNRWAKGSKAILFAPNLASAEEVWQEFTSAGLPTIALNGSAGLVERRNALKWYKETAGAILINVGLFTTGFDEPSIETVILYRATKSLPLFLQMVGRGSRTCEGKTSFRVLDFGNNLYRFGMWDEDRDWTKPPKKHRDGVAVYKNCPKCDAFIYASARVCEYCGAEIPKTEREVLQELAILQPHEARAMAKLGGLADWVALTKANKLHPLYVLQSLCKLRSEAEAYRDAMGYAKGWLFIHKDKTRHLL